MYSYLRGIYKGHAPDDDEAILVEAAGIGYEVIVPPIVDQEIVATYADDDALLLYVSTQSGRDQPWPILFGFLTARQKAFWELLVSVPARRRQGRRAGHDRAHRGHRRGHPAGQPRLSGRFARHHPRRRRQDDRQPAEKGRARSSSPRRAFRRRNVRRSEADEIRDDAVSLLVVMGIKRPEAQRGVDQLLASREDVTSIQDIVTEYFRAQHARTERCR